MTMMGSGRGSWSYLRRVYDGGYSTKSKKYKWQEMETQKYPGQETLSLSGRELGVYLK